MTAESQAPSRDQREADLLAHQRGLEGAVQAWHNDVIAEGHHTDRRTNETNIRALKARRTVLEEQITATRRALRAIRKG